MSIADLAPDGTQRCVASRKAAVVRGVVYGLLSKDDALERYNLSDDEFIEWVKAVSTRGEAALKATMVQNTDNVRLFKRTHWVCLRLG